MRKKRRGAEDDSLAAATARLNDGGCRYLDNGDLEVSAAIACESHKNAKYVCVSLEVDPTAKPCRTRFGSADLELVSEPIVFVSMTFYSKRAASQPFSWKRHLLDALEHMLSRVRSHSSIC